MKPFAGMVPMSAGAFAMAVAVASWVAVPGGAWTPSADDLASLRERLPKAVREAAQARHLRLPIWSSYTFQYQGRVEAGERRIYINAFCTAPPADVGQRFVVVFDGGSCYFQAVYSPATRRFHDIAFNGEA